MVLLGKERDAQLQEYLDWCLDNLRYTNDDDELDDFLQIFFGVRIPRDIIVPGNSSPFNFIADTFFERELDTLCIGNRNGGKTMAYGLKNALDGLFKGCEIASIGAIVAQAEKQYSYTQGFLSKPFINQYLKTSIMKNTIVETKNGKAIIQILPGTMNGVNSPHPQKANVDEIELMDWKVLQEAMSMPCSKNDTRASLCMTSSRKFSYGNMEKLLKEAEQRMLTVYKWSIWETIEKCQDDRSGTIPCKYTYPMYGKNELDTVTVYTKNEDLYNKEITSDVAKKEPHIYTGCLACPLVEVCHGKAKKSNGFYKIDDTVKKFRIMDRETWDSQWESLKAMTKGLVYKQFKEETHVLKGDSQWEYNPNYPCNASLDAGFEHNAVLSIFQEDSTENIYLFDDVVRNHTTSHELVTLYWLPKLTKYGFVNNPKKVVYYDPSAKDEAEQLKQKGIKMIAADNSVDSGIKSVRSFLKSAGGKTRFYINERCTNPIWEFSVHHYKDDSEDVCKEDDHSLDTIRYYIHTRYPLQPKNKKFGARILSDDKK